MRIRTLLHFFGAFLAVLAVTVLLSGELSAQNEQRIRIIHLSPGGPNVNGKIDGQTKIGFDDIAYGSASAGSVLLPGNHEVTVEDGDDQELLSTSVDLPENRVRSVVLVNTPTALEHVILPYGGQPAPAENMTGLRFMHANPNLGRVDILVTETNNGTQTKIEDVSFKDLTEYNDYSRATLTIEVFKAGTPQQLFSTNWAMASSGLLNHATIFIAGTAQEPDLMRINDVEYNKHNLPRFDLTIGQIGMAKLRMVHVVAGGAPAVDVFVDNNPQAKVSGLQFRDASSLDEYTEGGPNFKIALAGLGIGSAVIDSTIEISSGVGYTVYAIGNITNPTSLNAKILTKFDNTTPSAGTGLVRVLHASHDAGNVDITVTGTDNTPHSVANIAYGEFNDYFEVPAGDIVVEVAATGGEVVYRASGEVDEGNIVTIIANGSLSGGNFQLSVLTDSEVSEQRPMTALDEIPIVTELGALRGVHVADGAPEVDLYLNEVMGGSVAYGDAGATIESEVGVQTVVVAEKGDPPTSGLLTVEPEIMNETLTSIFVIDNGTELEAVMMNTVRDDITTIPSGKAHLRLLHASPDAGTVDVEVTDDDDNVKTYEDVELKGMTTYEVVADGPLRIRLLQGGEEVLVVDGPLEESAYTAVITGKVADNSLRIYVLDDGDVGAQKPMLMLQPTNSAPILFTGVTSLSVAPNPVVGSALIRYTLEKGTELSAELYDLRGGLIRTVPVGFRSTGEGTVAMETNGIAAGSYTVVLRDGAGTVLGALPIIIAR